MYRSYELDAALILKDAGLVAASAAGTVGGAARVIDLGAGMVEGQVILDVTAIEIASNDEEYDILLQGCTNENFAAADTEILAQFNLGATEVRQGGAKDSTTGSYRRGFSTVVNGTNYPFVRIYTVVAGSIASGINFSAFLHKLPGV